MLIVSTFAGAEDVVRLTNGQTLRGQIQQYDERGVEIRLESGATPFYRTSQVESVESAFTQQHRAATEAMARRDYAGAIALLGAALDEERRPWARYQIQSALVRARQSLGKWDEAGRLFLEIVAARQDMEVMALAPLVWVGDEPLDKRSLLQARQWISDARPMARLIAASWLLAQPESGNGKETLEELVAVEPRIGAMARAQLWRVARSTDANEIERFKAQIGRLPQSVRAGPQFVLADVLEREGRHEDAALAFLWIAYVYSPGSDLSAEALLRAANCCRQCSFLADADRIYGQVIDEYPGTPWAARAQKERAGVAKPTEPSP